MNRAPLKERAHRLFVDHELAGDISEQTQVQYFIELLTFSDPDEISEMLDSTQAAELLALPVWIRNLAYRLLCLQRPDDPAVLRRAAGDLYLFGPDWDAEAADLNARAARLEQDADGAAG
ncbi:hypothetical protein Afil01_31000 [Actinorhabdospora filicis]|uniref:Uncharacterized protein n=1 Tax=Actinorhabdospora filicis TaxID=1785913 RepID=A0A9W6W9S3_9ACTN|nr:hypothetical protein [Actinorhabdospora filicis]GLZ78293.1 hypothetical protein Afil01_31000 [Actinorhabdospora filicis]